MPVLGEDEVDMVVKRQDANGTPTRRVPVTHQMRRPPPGAYSNRWHGSLLSRRGFVKQFHSNWYSGMCKPNPRPI